MTLLARPMSFGLAWFMVRLEAGLGVLGLVKTRCVFCRKKTGLDVASTIPNGGELSILLG